MTIRFEYWLHYDHDADKNEFMASEKLEKGNMTLAELKELCWQVMWLGGDHPLINAPKYAVEVIAYSDQLFSEPMCIHWDCQGCDVKRELYRGERL